MRTKSFLAYCERATLLLLAVGATSSCRQTPTSGFLDYEGDVVVTGFGDWANSDGSMVKNPTGAMIQSGDLQSALRQEYDRNGRDFPADKYKFSVLPVNGGSAGTPTTDSQRQAETAYIDQLQNQNTRHVINLGVNPNADGRFAVEPTAINNYQGKPITTAVPANAYYETSAKSPTYYKDLNSDLGSVKGQNFTVASGTPLNQNNNFDCNSTFWNAMSNVDQTGANKNRVYNADFVHVPLTSNGQPVETRPTAEATAKILYQTVEGNPGMNAQGQKSAIRPVIPAASTSSAPMASQNSYPTSPSSGSSSSSSSGAGGNTYIPAKTSTSLTGE